MSDDIVVSEGDFSGMLFGQESLNRVSFLRADLGFIKATVAHESTVFIVFVNGEALLREDGRSLYVTTLKEDPRLGKAVRKLVPLLGTAGIRQLASGINLTFLGLKEPQGGVKEDCFTYKELYTGTPYYGVDLRLNNRTLINEGELSHLLSLNAVGRNSVFEMENEVASLYSHAKMYLNWLGKYKYCPDCGSPMYPVDGGTKLRCSNENLETFCEVRDMPVNNVCFPRTDPVVIVAITTRDFSKICLARSKRKIKDTVMYSTIAGFMEPSETLEKACSREIWEETGIRCNDISIVCSQPWPYPVNLMIGCYGIVDFNGKNEIINLNHDDEIMDAKWFNTSDICGALENYKGERLMKLPKTDITIPGTTAIAHHLIKLVCDKYKRSHASL